MNNQSVIIANKISRCVINVCHLRSCNFHSRAVWQQYTPLMYNMSRKNSIDGPANANLYVIGTGSESGCTALLLATDHKRYLFNCGEVTQRLVNEYKHKLSKLTNVFVTSAKWKHIGGLPGLVLTWQSMVPEEPDKHLMVHGPKNIKNMFQILKNSWIMSQVNVTMIDVDVYEEYSDNVITVSCIPIYSNAINMHKNTSGTTLDHDLDNDTSNINGKRNHSEQEIVNKRKLSERNIPILSYICKIADKLGTLDFEKCMEKGLKPGPILGILKNGSDVTLPDGSVVKHEDVCTPKQKGLTFIVADCPNNDYIESFVNNTKFKKYHKSISNENDEVFCIAHFTPQEILDNPKYKEWMNKFGPNTYHLIINETNTCSGSEAVYKQQYIFNVLHPKIFPYLYLSSLENESNVQHQNVNTGDTQRIYYAKTLQKIALRPGPMFNTETLALSDPDTYLNDIYELDDFADALAELQTNIDKEAKALLDVEEYPKFVMLGTGSSVPSKSRSTSAILVEIDKDHSMLLDCSEGTLCQMSRLVNPSKFKQLLASIKAIYISHLHADHHLGLIALLQARANITKDPIYLLIPNNLKPWLEVYHNDIEPIKHYFKIIPNHDMYVKHNQSSSIVDELCTALNVKKINTTSVRHCSMACGVALIFKNDKKIVYSGDTMPCQGLLELGKNCDLLIHEATFQDELIDQAISKRHSTTSEAIQMGEKMKAGFTLLTHFSQRHTKIPILPNESEFDMSKVGIAYDYMHFNLSQLKFIPFFHSCLKIIFLDQLIETNNRMVRRKRRKLQQ